MSVLGGTVNRMNFFDVAPWGDLLPRKLRRFLGVALMLSVAFLPPVQTWWMGQVEEHAKDRATRIVEIVFSEPTGSADSGSH